MTKQVATSTKQKLLEDRERHKAKLLKIDEELKRIDLKATKAESARETRKFIILGRSLMASQRAEHIATAEELIQSLSKPQDREAFGLPPLSKTAPNPSEDNAPPLPSFDHELTLSLARDETSRDGDIF